MNRNNENAELPRLKVSFVLNGKRMTLEVRPWDTALHTLREDLGLTGAKEGCGIGECGACTILVDGLAVDSCLILAPQLDGRDVQTVEGLANGKASAGRAPATAEGSPAVETEAVLHPLQEAFIAHGAVQCGFCTPGVLMSAKALLDKQPSPSRQDIVEALSGNLCRCTGYVQIVEAVEQAAITLRDEEPEKTRT
jgi:aerobic carbon-monoxide dehydrogenase small subunit